MMHLKSTANWKQVSNMRNHKSAEFDIAAVDKEENLILAVQVKTREITDEDKGQFAAFLEERGEDVPFVMFADPTRIQLFQWNGRELSAPIATLQTSAILLHYEPEFGNKRIFIFYLIALLKAWLRDLAYHWKSDNPPASAEIRRAGLLDRLEGGTTVPDLEVGGKYLRNLP